MKRNPKSIRRLKREAITAASWRKHIMTKFKTIRQDEAISHCKDCDAQVHVNASPLPNEIEIGGEAVRLIAQRNKWKQ